MAGEVQAADIAGYLSRLLGEHVAPDQEVRLRSVHKVAFLSWVRKQNLPVDAAIVTGGGAFSADQLVSGIAAPAPARAMAVASSPGGSAGIGIDIEEVLALPEAEDYREHPFFRDNFTAAEIAYCLRQPNPRASFCGIWAAKEATLKAGLAEAPDGRLNRIGIGHDERGRPIVAGGQLSISHTPTTAVAVCIAAPARVARPPAPQHLPPAGSRPVEDSSERRRPALLAAAGFAVVLVGGAITLGWHAWP